MASAKKKATRKPRKTKKVSTGDFLNLLDDQERSRGPMAFKPSANKKGQARSRKRKLTPVQKEWIDLALKISPQPVSDFLKSDQAQKWFVEAESQVSRVTARINQFLGRN